MWCTLRVARERHRGYIPQPVNRHYPPPACASARVVVPIAPEALVVLVVLMILVAPVALVLPALLVRLVALVLLAARVMLAILIIPVILFV
jgi:hypothetical protein